MSTTNAASLSIVESTGAASAAPVVPEPDSPLADVSEAYSYLESCRDRERRAKGVLVECVLDARDAGHTLAEIAAALGTTRQYVQKLLREAARDEEREAFLAARYDPENARRSLGKTGGYTRPQCAGCKRFLKAAGAQCSSCGYLDGGGYFAAPAQTSHLERWR